MERKWIENENIFPCIDLYYLFSFNFFQDEEEVRPFRLFDDEDEWTFPRFLRRDESCTSLHHLVSHGNIACDMSIAMLTQFFNFICSTWWRRKRVCTCWRQPVCIAENSIKIISRWFFRATTISWSSHSVTDQEYAVTHIVITLPYPN